MILFSVRWVIALANDPISRFSVVEVLKSCDPLAVRTRGNPPPTSPLVSLAVVLSDESGRFNS